MSEASHRQHVMKTCADCVSTWTDHFFGDAEKTQTPRPRPRPRLRRAMAWHSRWLPFQASLQTVWKYRSFAHYRSLRASVSTVHAAFPQKTALGLKRRTRTRMRTRLRTAFANPPMIPAEMQHGANLAAFA